MQYYECKCGEATAFGSMSPDKCTRCAKCGARLLNIAYKAKATEEDWKPAPHEWKTYYVVNTGKPYEKCAVCFERKSEEVK
jgi:hypothetical protein